MVFTVCWLSGGLPSSSTGSHEVFPQHPPASCSVVSVVFQALESLSPLRSPKPDLVGDHTRVSLDERGMYGMFFNEQFMKFLSYMFRKFFKLKSTNISPRKQEFAAARMQALVFKIYSILKGEGGKKGGGKDKKKGGDVNKEA